MLICSAAAALAATLIAGPVVSADPAPPAGPSFGDRVTPGYGPEPGAPGGYGPGSGYGPGHGPGRGYAPAVLPVAGPVPAMRPPAEPKQAVYHLKGKDGVRHDVFVVPISDDPSQPITLPDFGFQRFTVTDKPRGHKSRAHKPRDRKAREHQGKKHRHGGKAHRRHR